MQVGIPERELKDSPSIADRGQGRTNPGKGVESTPSVGYIPLDERRNPGKGVERYSVYRWTQL